MRVFQEQITVTPSTRQDFDVLRDPWASVPWEQYDVVINALGVIPQKDRDPVILRRVNGEFPRVVSAWCRRWIQVSTDCVFSGARGGYATVDHPDPVDVYGQSKLQGEVGLVVRGSFVGAGEPRSLLEVVRQQRVMPGYIDHLWNGVSCLEMARVLLSLAQGDMSSGLVHVAGPDRVSKYVLCQMIAETYDHRITLRPETAGSIDRTLVPTLPVLMPLRQQLDAQRRFDDVTH